MGGSGTQRATAPGGQWALLRSLACFPRASTERGLRSKFAESPSGLRRGEVEVRPRQQAGGEGRRGEAGSVGITSIPAEGRGGCGEGALLARRSFMSSGLVSCLGPR